VGAKADAAIFILQSADSFDVRYNCTMAEQTDDAAIRLILEGTAQETGEEFFRALVKRLAQVLGTAAAWVTEYDEKAYRLKAIAFWHQNGFISHYEYPLADTPCEAVIRSCQLFHVSDQITLLFPNDADLKPFNAVSYLGMPLLDKNANIL